MGWLLPSAHRRCMGSPCRMFRTTTRRTPCAAPCSTRTQMLSSTGPSRFTSRRSKGTTRRFRASSPAWRSPKASKHRRTRRATLDIAPLTNKTGSVLGLMQIAREQDAKNEQMKAVLCTKTLRNVPGLKRPLLQDEDRRSDEDLPSEPCGSRWESTLLAKGLMTCEGTGQQHADAFMPFTHITSKKSWRGLFLAANYLIDPSAFRIEC